MRVSGVSRQHIQHDSGDEQRNRKMDDDYVLRMFRQQNTIVSAY
ncbi:MAG TPA: hypothetical protein VHV29_02120 [Terriglobales bacterium]|nr:hypothetical protein [Terriglobales bacterium]